MAKTINGAIGFVSGTTPATNYVKQISDGTTTHDIAVQSGIKFFNGASEVQWDGTQAVEVVIPTVDQLISSPIVFAGTVDSSGSVSYATGFGPSPVKGYLVYITEDCTFESKACEAGDMAVYDGAAWRVISGENQITINASAATVDGNDNLFSITGTAKTLLSVEGKTLSVVLDYADVRSKMAVVTNATALTLPVQNATVSVAAIGLALSKAADGGLDISKSESIVLPSALADGTVTFTDNKVLTSADISLSGGSFPTVRKNADTVPVTVSHNLSIGKENESDGVTGDYLTSVVAIKGASISSTTAASAQLTFVDGLTADSTNAKSFVTAIHAWTSEDGEKPADFTIPGAVTAPAASNTFITGLDASEAASGDVVSSVTIGTVSLDAAGSGILTGLSEGNDVITSVSFGQAEVDTSASWFYSGLGEAGTTGDVVSDVTVGEVSLVADNNGGSPAITSASVNASHVLVFNTGNFQTPVTISQANSTISKKSFTKTGVKLTGFGSTAAGFTTASLKQADSTISYKSFTSSAVSLSAGSTISYYIDTDKEHAYTASISYARIDTVDATYTKNSPKLENTTITATISANTFVTALNTDGAFPTLEISEPSGRLSASVDTTLTTSNVTWLGIDATKLAAVSIPGAYSLVSVSENADVTVAAASNYGVSEGTVTIASDTFLTGIEVSGVSVSPKVNA